MKGLIKCVVETLSLLSLHVPYSLVRQMLALMCVVVCVAWVRAGDIVTVEGGGASGLPPQIQGTGLTMSFCAVSGKECKGSNISKKFAPAASECMKRCGKDPKCLNAFYSAEKTCHLRKNRCDTGSRTDSPAGAIYFHRVKDGESCPADTPDYLPSIPKYSKSFCLMKGKSCKGRDLYKRPQKINTILACLKKCVGINECSMVDYSPGQCALKGDKCADTELKDTAGTDNYLRLEDNVLHCPGNREVPAQTLQPQPAGPPPEDPKEEICVETVELETDLPRGTVSALRKCGVQYQIKTVDEGKEICERNGAVLATKAQLEKALEFGMSFCSCGWYGEGEAGYPSAPNSGCVGSGLVNCPASAKTVWGPSGSTGWDVYCYMKKEVCDDVPVARADLATGQLMLMRKCGERYQIPTFEEGKEICKKNGMEIAENAHLLEAWAAGMSYCSCGWWSAGDKRVHGFPNGPRGGCGANMVAICPASGMGVWGGPGSIGWDVFCFKTANCKSRVEGPLISGDDKISEAECGSDERVAKCKCLPENSNGFCDGAYLNRRGKICQASGAGGGGKIKAVACCTPKTDLRAILSEPHDMNDSWMTVSQKARLYGQGASVTCDETTGLIQDCMVHSYWAHQYKDAMTPIVEGNSCSAASGCKRCAVMAVCSGLECLPRTSKNWRYNNNNHAQYLTVRTCSDDMFVHDCTCIAREGGYCGGVTVSERGDICRAWSAKDGGDIKVSACCKFREGLADNLETVANPVSMKGYYTDEMIAAEKDYLAAPSVSCPAGKKINNCFVHSFDGHLYRDKLEPIIEGATCKTDPGCLKCGVMAVCV